MSKSKQQNTEPMEAKGRIITFYSYKGGTGRTMVLANVAWALAAAGKRVLAMDWDMEAPGLHRYFHPFLSDPRQDKSPGLIDRLLEYMERDGRDDALDLADLSDLVQRLTLPKVAKGSLEFIGAGRQDAVYATRLGEMDWNRLYVDCNGADFIDAIGDWARSHYDYVLVDSRTGVADSAGVSTAQLPDQVVMCFIYNRQNIEGTAAVAHSIIEQSKILTRNVSLFPLPSRVQDKEAAAVARKYAADLFRDVFPMLIGGMERTLLVSEIRHYPWCAFGERLAVLNDDPEESSSLLRDIHTLTQRIIGTDITLVGLAKPEERATLWRRAALADPRLADLERLTTTNSIDVLPQLRTWLIEAGKDSELRQDWAFGLADAVLSISGLELIERQTLGLTALAFCRRFSENNKARLGMRMSFLLLKFSRSFYGTEALQYVHEAMENASLDVDKRARSLQSAKVLIRQAELLEEVGRYAEALDIMRRLRSRSVRSLERVRIDSLLSRLYIKTGSIDEAEKAAMSAIDLLAKYTPFPSRLLNPQLYITMASVSIDRGDFLGALAFVRKAHKSGESGNLQAAELALIEATAFSGLNRGMEAWEALLQAEAIIFVNKDASPYKRAELSALAASMFLDFGRPEKARKIADYAMSLMPKEESIKFSVELLELIGRIDEVQDVAARKREELLKKIAEMDWEQLGDIEKIIKDNIIKAPSKPNEPS